MNDHLAEPFRSILNAAVPVTDFRVDRVDIAADHYARLSSATKRLIEIYATGFRYVDGCFRFEIAMYRWAEVAATETPGLLAAVPAGAEKDKP